MMGRVFGAPLADDTVLYIQPLVMFLWPCYIDNGAMMGRVFGAPLADDTVVYIQPLVMFLWSCYTDNGAMMGRVFGAPLADDTVVYIQPLVMFLRQTECKIITFIITLINFLNILKFVLV